MGQEDVGERISGAERSFLSGASNENYYDPEVLHEPELKLL